MKRSRIILILCVALALVCTAMAVLIKTTYNDSSSLHDERPVDPGSIYTDTSSEEAGVSSTLSDMIRFDENGREMIYDIDTIICYYNDDTSVVLSDKQKEYLKEAEMVLSEITDDKMSDYEKELAIHDWIILNNVYDDDHLSPISGRENDDDSSPYGVLINKMSICKGYAVTFELLCRMSGIECRTLSQYEKKVISHAYNCVKIEGSWYYVDITWNDNDNTTNKDNISHKYFNMTDRQMEFNHNLPKDSPKSDSLKYCYAANNYIKIRSYDEFERIVSEHFESNNVSELVFLFDDSLGLELSMNREDEDCDNIYSLKENAVKLLSILKNTGKNYTITKIKCNNDIMIMVELKIK